MQVPQDQSGGPVADRSSTSWRRWLLVAALGMVSIVGVAAAMTASDAPADSGHPAAHESKELPVPQKKKFPVSIRKPSGPPRVKTGLRDLAGNEVTAACSTCHATREPNFTNATAKDFNEFHGGMKYSHGKISCLSCHNEHDYDALKLADGTRVEFANVMTLCGQCHGPQMTAYEHGAHGGMNGYWDLTRGPQTKNNCIDCHDPHTPQFPKMQPTFKPQDRFLNPPRREH